MDSNLTLLPVLASEVDSGAAAPPSLADWREPVDAGAAEDDLGAILVGLLRQTEK